MTIVWYVIKKNVLNVKNSSINICFEKKDKIDSITSQNIDYINSSIQKENNNYKNKETNDKNEANELFKKNKIWKNLKIKKPSINKPKSFSFGITSNPNNAKISLF